MKLSNIIKGKQDQISDPIDLTSISGSIIPSQNKTLSLGTPTNRWKEIYAEDIHMGLNTLYIGDTPILGTEMDTVVIKTDPDQSMNIQTFGTGITNMTSVSGVNISTSGLNGDVDIKSTGAGGKVKFGSISSINFTSPVSNIDGALSVLGNLTVTGNTTFNGSPVVVNAEVVQVKDNIIVVNHGETGNGVTSGTAGLRVDRGELEDFLMVYDESVDRFRVGKIGSLQTIATQDWVNANTTMSWNNLEDKPSSFEPSTHTHGSGDITSFWYGNWEPRRMVHSAANPSGGSNGDVWLKY